MEQKTTKQTTTSNNKKTKKREKKSTFFERKHCHKLHAAYHSEIFDHVPAADPNVEANFHQTLNALLLLPHQVHIPTMLGPHIQHQRLKRTLLQADRAAENREVVSEDVDAVVVDVVLTPLGPGIWAAALVPELQFRHCHLSSRISLHRVHIHSIFSPGERQEVGQDNLDWLVESDLGL